MKQHYISLTFNNIVENFGDKFDCLVKIAQLIADKFGDKVDASFLLSRDSSFLRAILFKEGTSFDDASTLVDQIREFLNSPEASDKFSISGISLSNDKNANEFSRRWPEIFSQVFSFDKK